MKSFSYPQCNNAFVLTTKKEYKQHPDDNSAKSKYVSLVGDTYIVIENIEEVLSDLDELQKLKVSIENDWKILLSAAQGVLCPSMDAPSTH